MWGGRAEVEVCGRIVEGMTFAGSGLLSPLGCEWAKVRRGARRRLIITVPGMVYGRNRSTFYRECWMSLNIKNEETHRRAKELARLAGESMTEAVDRAIAERLERIRKRRNKAALVGRLLEIGHECARLPVLDERCPHDMLYDQQGLPK